jgi:hypothetical protein
MALFRLRPIGVRLCGSTLAVDAVECSNGVRLVRLRDPWGVKQWRGPWSDGSVQWQASDNAGLLAELEYEFGDDGTFWMSYEDLVGLYSSLIQFTYSSKVPGFNL